MILAAFYCCFIIKSFDFFPVRTILATSVISSYSVLSKTLEKQFGSRWLQWFIAITVTQSHFMFYLSRPLPNIMALPLGNYYLWKVIDSNKTRIWFYTLLKINNSHFIIECNSILFLIWIRCKWPIIIANYISIF